MAKSSSEHLAVCRHDAEAFIVWECPGCGRLFVLRGRMTPVEECASGDEANARVKELAGEHVERNPSGCSLVVVAEQMIGIEPLSPDDDASPH